MVIFSHHSLANHQINATDTFSKRWVNRFPRNMYRRYATKHTHALRMAIEWLKIYDSINKTRLTIPLKKVMNLFWIAFFRCQFVTRNYISDIDMRVHRHNTQNYIQVASFASSDIKYMGYILPTHSHPKNGSLSLSVITVENVSHWNVNYYQNMNTKPGDTHKHTHTHRLQTLLLHSVRILCCHGILMNENLVWKRNI